MDDFNIDLRPPCVMNLYILICAFICPYAILHISDIYVKSNIKKPSGDIPTTLMCSLK